MNNPLHSSKSPEHYTPAPIIEAARRVMGGINLDPATGPEANQITRAEQIFTAASDGLNSPWPRCNSVWLNPPGGKVVWHKEQCKWLPSRGGGTGAQAAWFRRLLKEYETGKIQQAIFLCFNLNGGPALCPEMLQFPSVFTSKAAQHPCVSKSGRIKFWIHAPSAIALKTAEQHRLMREDPFGNRNQIAKIEHQIETLYEQRAIGPNGEFREQTAPTHPNLLVFLPPKQGSRAVEAFEYNFSQFGSYVYSEARSDSLLAA